MSAPFGRFPDPHLSSREVSLINETLDTTWLLNGHMTEEDGRDAADFVCTQHYSGVEWAGWNNESLRGLSLHCDSDSSLTRQQRLELADFRNSLDSSNNAYVKGLFNGLRQSGALVSCFDMRDDDPLFDFIASNAGNDYFYTYATKGLDELTFDDAQHNFDRTMQPIAMVVRNREITIRTNIAFLLLNASTTVRDYGRDIKARFGLVIGSDHIPTARWSAKRGISTQMVTPHGISQAPYSQLVRACMDGPPIYTQLDLARSMLTDVFSDAAFRHIRQHRNPLVDVASGQTSRMIDELAFIFASVCTLKVMRSVWNTHNQSARDDQLDEHLSATGALDEVAAIVSTGQTAR